jgi:hypothetical protein
MLRKFPLHGFGRGARPRRRGHRSRPLFAAAYLGRSWHFSDLAQCPLFRRYVLLMDALGTRDWDFLQGFLAQLASAAGSKGGKVDGQTLNFMLSVVKGIEPKDQVEALLAAQMAAVHTAFMTFAFRLAHVKTLPQQDSAERTFNKLARTFATQMEALKRYRRRGDQTVRVEHVTVNEGGQAIVGNVNHGGRGPLKNQEATP